MAKQLENLRFVIFVVFIVFVVAKCRSAVAIANLNLNVAELYLKKLSRRILGEFFVKTTHKTDVIAVTPIKGVPHIVIGLT